MKKIWVLFFAVKAIFIIGFLWGVSASAAPILSYGAYCGLKVFVSAQSFTYSENMPIEAFDNKFEGDFPNDGNYALTYNRYGAGIGFAGIELGFFERKDYFFRTVSDTFDLVYMDQNDIDFPINQLFYVYLHVQAVEASGVNFGYRFKPAPELEFYVGGTYFESQDALYGSMAGTILDDGSRPRGDLIVDYIYTEEYLLDRPLTPPASGYGYGFDVLMAWQALPNVAIKADFYDVQGRINWKHAPHTRAEMVSNRNRVDAEGKPYKVPTLKGEHGFKEVTQLLPVHRVLAVEYVWRQKYQFTLEQETYDRVDFTRLLAAYQPLGWFKVEAGYDTQSKAKSIELWTPYGALLVAVDKTDFKQAKNIRMELALSYSF